MSKYNVFFTPKALKKHHVNNTIVWEKKRLKEYKDTFLRTESCSLYLFQRWNRKRVGCIYGRTHDFCFVGGGGGVGKTLFFHGTLTTTSWEIPQGGIILPLLWDMVGGISPRYPPCARLWLFILHVLVFIQPTYNFAYIIWKTIILIEREVPLPPPSLPLTLIPLPSLSVPLFCFLFIIPFLFFFFTLSQAINGLSLCLYPFIFCIGLPHPLCFHVFTTTTQGLQGRAKGQQMKF